METDATQLEPAVTMIVLEMQIATGGRSAATQILLAVAILVRPTKKVEAKIVSVPTPPEPTYVKQATPLLPVMLVAKTPLLGPLVTANVTVTPTRGFVGIKAGLIVATVAQMV